VRRDRGTGSLEGGVRRAGEHDLRAGPRELRAIEEPQTVEDIAEGFVRGLPVLEDSLGRLRALPSPAGSEGAVEMWLARFEDLLSVFRRMTEAAARGDRSALARGWKEAEPIGAAVEDGAWTLGAWACTGADARRPPRVVKLSFGQRVRDLVVDTDMGAEDSMALLYLLQRPDVVVRAVTVAGTGLAHCRAGVRNALGLLALAGNKEVPVACGRERPLRGHRAFPPRWRRAADRLLGVALPPGGGPASPRPAVDLLASAVRSARGDVSVVALGPLTNVGEALLREPALARELAAVYVMGGAFAAPGNVEGKSAEWNLYVDPEAADVVLRSGPPVTLIPLDATNQIPVTRSFYEGIKAARGTPEAGFVYDLLTRQRDLIESGGYFFWDPLAAAAFTDQSLISTERRRLKIATRGPLAGWTWIASNGDPARVAVSAKRARFEQTFLSVLNLRAP
jgi:inosine-uridine nucleoside N-ribohydrolase